ncbi:hypothetical protein MMC10_006812 [Thelotrema lepadinum]|nr:hypothetical protein [Thelotrema lepadinum]
MLPDIPIEIMHAIYTHLETCDVKNFRQTSRIFGEIGLEHLIRQTDMVVAEASIARLEALSLHPVVSKRVKAINLCHLVCKPYLEPGELRERTEIVREMTTSIHDLQLPLIESGTFIAAVKATLPRLSALQSITFPEAVPSTDDRMYMELVPRSMEPLLDSIGWKKEELWRAFLMNNNIASQLLQVVLAMLCHSSPRGISLDYPCWPEGVMEKDISSWRVGLQKLAHLKIDFWETPEFFDDPWLPLQKLAAFISMASNLTSLDLALGCWTPYCVEPHCPFTEPFLPKLKRLVIHVESLKANTLLQFLKRHNNTLESLLLWAACFDSELDIDWIHFFERAMAESITLESLELVDMLENEEWWEELGITYAAWPTLYPDTVPPGRALRFLVCQKKTDMEGKRDAVFWHTYDWDSITWTSIASDLQRVTRDAQLAQKREWAKRWARIEAAEREQERNGESQNST